ncbi:uncharacterized protein B0H18DRAFT_1023541 [Fomitopsis serialis]|uniref:uncharacterized protein n=1 Tax=Fomitopsis serialis TaxID=139415 RepID=UPI002007E117|nr:uncharacterized protein B0H18DRAFT_1023541 [Neoantrodia serialis]KAH9920606.1 hypothetical protein B0H18DRAFT_1023541 [Neoantrodia serialis]
MPKAPSTTFTHVRAGDWQSPNNPHALRRNQACHQCRKRKLVSTHPADAKRPCTTCIRSHAYALSHAPPGAQMPRARTAHMIWVIPDLSGLQQQDPPEGRLEKLENRIAELETLLAESAAQGRPSHIPIDPSLLPDSGHNVQQMRTCPPLRPHAQTGALNSLAEAAALSVNSHQMQIEEEIPLHVPRPHPIEENMPGPELLRHLVEAYFSFNADANRLLHRPTFMANLSLPPTHPRFPVAPLLHAICAVGSFYTAAVDPAPKPMRSPFPMDDPFDGRHWMHARKPYSFAEAQVKYAQETILGFGHVGSEIFQAVQAEILLSTWYWASAKCAYMTISRSLRSCTPMGLNVAAPFQALSGSSRPPSLLSPPKTALEEELRRNAFWLAYASERTMGAGHGWALMLDDEDVSQLLPVCGDDFDEERSVPSHERQWSHDHDILIRHPPRQTDPFILYIKSCILISRVKNFNSRFRAKYYAGDPATLPVGPNGERTPIKDIRTAPAFTELNQLINDFQSSIPPHWKRPVQNGVVNAHLFAAVTTPHLAIILLHEAHAHIESETCPSSLRILTAARGILNLMYDVCATSYNLSLLGQFVVAAWFMAGRVLIRFLRIAVPSNATQHTATLIAELDFIR